MVPVLTLLIALPVAGAIVVALLPRRRPELVFPIALVMSFLPLAVALWVLADFTVGDPSGSAGVWETTASRGGSSF
jgi:NADH:ubiquinone oxidoreductase subunit 4 (subunit M)